jgi:cation diffusion facilitator family transporter
MHAESMAAWTHDHVFLGVDHARNERRTRIVIALCCTIMVAEIVGGILFRSMALVADGLHMSTHAAALLIAAMALPLPVGARTIGVYLRNRQVGDLAGFTSAIVLAMIALLIAWESVGRLIHPLPIAFDEAIPIATLGLGVNLLSAWLLKEEHEHDHHEHSHHHSRDLNLRAAYLHVLADAAVSILAVIGLVVAREFEWLWIDAAMGIIGAAVISNWALALVRAAGAVLPTCIRGAWGRDTTRLSRRSCHTSRKRQISTKDVWQTSPVSIM